VSGPAAGPERDAARSAPRTVIVFVREPVRGRVKTRLAAEVGADAALRVYVRLAEHAVREALELGSGTRVRVHFTPAGAGDAVRRWLGDGPDFLPQVDGDLGERMNAAFASAFADGCQSAVIIGSDLPGISAEILRRAFDLLDAHPVVIGPAYDGGYYLLGLREPRPELFDGIPWSTERVLDCTLHRLRGSGISPPLLEPLRDVDRAADLPPEFRTA